VQSHQHIGFQVPDTFVGLAIHVKPRVNPTGQDFCDPLLLL